MILRLCCLGGLVLRGLVRYAGPSSLGSSFGTGIGTLRQLCVRVAMGAGVGCCHVPLITFGAWIGGILGATPIDWMGGNGGTTLGAWIGGMRGTTLGDWMGGNVGATLVACMGGIVGTTSGYWVGVLVGARRGAQETLLVGRLCWYWAGPVSWCWPFVSGVG